MWIFRDHIKCWERIARSQYLSLYLQGCLNETCVQRTYLPMILIFNVMDHKGLTEFILQRDSKMLLEFAESDRLNFF